MRQKRDANWMQKRHKIEHKEDKRLDKIELKIVEKRCKERM